MEDCGQAIPANSNSAATSETAAAIRRNLGFRRALSPGEDECFMAVRFRVQRSTRKTESNTLGGALPNSLGMRGPVERGVSRVGVVCNFASLVVIYGYVRLRSTLPQTIHA